VVEVVYPKCKKLETGDLTERNGVIDRALSQLPLPAWTLSQQQAGVGSGGGGGSGEVGSGGGAGDQQQQVVFDAADPLPADLVQRHELMGWSAALYGLHKPLSSEHHQAARERVAFQVGG